jgi:hypothetical protein
MTTPTKTSLRAYATEARDWLRAAERELAKSEPEIDWHWIARCANEASGNAGQIAGDIEEAHGVDPRVADPYTGGSA